MSSAPVPINDHHRTASRLGLGSRARPRHRQRVVAAFPAGPHNRPRRFSALVGALRVQNLYPRNGPTVSRNIVRCELAEVEEVVKVVGLTGVTIYPLPNRMAKTGPRPRYYVVGGL
jgi:hypothetical protein